MKLPTSTRNALPKSSFGIPSQRKYPLNDAAHAINAKSRATQQVNAGKLAPSTAASIKAKADRVLRQRGIRNPGNHAAKLKSI